MIRSFKIELKNTALSSLDDQLNKLFKSLESSGWKIISVNSHDCKIWDYPEYKPGVCYIVIAEHLNENKINNNRSLDKETENELYSNSNNKIEDEVYYKLYLDGGYIYIVKIEWGDESKYDNEKFVKMIGDYDYRFNSYDDAKEFLSKYHRVTNSIQSNSISSIDDFDNIPSFYPGTDICYSLNNKDNILKIDDLSKRINKE